MNFLYSNSAIAFLLMPPLLDFKNKRDFAQLKDCPAPSHHSICSMQIKGRQTLGTVYTLVRILLLSLTLYDH